MHFLCILDVSWARISVVLAEIFGQNNIYVRRINTDKIYEDLHPLRVSSRHNVLKPGVSGASSWFSFSYRLSRFGENLTSFDIS